MAEVSVRLQVAWGMGSPSAGIPREKSPVDGVSFYDLASEVTHRHPVC